jgi:hypothetical protein
MTRIPFTCDGNHDALSLQELYSHHSRPCRDDLTREAKNTYQRANRAAKAANAAAAPVVDAPAPSAVAFVDHFAAAKTPAAPAPKPAPPTGGGFDMSSLGTARRLRALMYMGYTPKELAHESGLTADSVWWLLIAPPARIQFSTGDQVDAAFKRLRVMVKSTDLDTNEGRSATRARAISELHDWAGPYDWERIDTDPKPTNMHRGHRDPAQLAKAIEEAKLDAPTAPFSPPTDLAEALRHKQILLDTAIAGHNDEINAHTKTPAQLAEATDTLTTRAAEYLAEHEAYVARWQANQAELDRLKNATPQTDMVITHPALAAAVDHMQISIDPTPEGGIRLTIPSLLLAR